MIKGLRKKKFRGNLPHQCVEIPEKEAVKKTEDSTSQFSIVPYDSSKGNGTHPETQDVPPEHQDMLLYCESEGALAQIAQGG